MDDLVPVPEDPTPDMLTSGVAVAAATGAVLSETQVHDIWQAMLDEWQASVLPKHPWYGPCDALGPNGECAECLKPSV